MRPTIRFEVPDKAWQICDLDSGEPRLLAKVEILDCMFHLEALPVKDTVAGQRGVTDEADTVLEGLYRAIEPDSPFMTATIRGREYVVWMSPLVK